MALNSLILFRVKEIEAKLEVITRSKQAAESTISEKVSHLEKALEEVCNKKSRKAARENQVNVKIGKSFIVF